MLRTHVESGAGRMASSWIEVDLDAIGHNVRVLRARLPADCRLIAVVKADAYGHGMVRVAREALQHGAAELAVATVAEGAALRSAGVTAPILIAGPAAAEEAHAVVQHGLVASLGGFELAEALARATRRFLPVQIEVDTGMARHGVSAAALPALVRSIADRGRLSIAGVFTHFQGLDGGDLPAMLAQLGAFVAATDGVRVLRGVRRHACNTLGALLLPEAALDAVRIGGGLYGLAPDLPATDAGGGVSLRPAMALKSVIVGLRHCAAGDRVGYGGAFVCTRPTRLALLPIGYADGLLRELWSGADVLVRGRRAPIVGAISMNQTVVDVTELPEVVYGEQVTLLGEVGDQRLTAARRVPPGGSVYEVTTLLGGRLPRRFVRGSST